MKRSARLAAVAAPLGGGGSKKQVKQMKTTTTAPSSTDTKVKKEVEAKFDGEDGVLLPYFTKKEVNNNETLEKNGGTSSRMIAAIAPTTSKKTTRLLRSFYDQDCLTLCKALLGTVLVRKLETGEVLRGTIVETEAYPGDQDQASQAYQGRRTPRNEAMFMAPGTAYVYFTYGMYFCYNISCRGEGAGCLIRAVEPLEDYETMHELRKPKPKKNAVNGAGAEKTRKRLKMYELANGPSKLCMAFGMDREKCDKLDMTTSDELWLEASKDLKYLKRNFEIATDKRIGIDSTPLEARNKLWRFYIKDNLAESRAKVKEIKTRLEM